MINLKGLRRKQSWYNLRYHPGIRLEGLRKAKRNVSQDSPSTGQDLSPGPPN
jgi:hypothetical protein